jgi:sigma-54 dependent transcriptional regulator, acetoin dehydrogenase operon transcriptional activator AcoR
VLQERRVNPLGSGKEYDVDLSIVCATNRPLKELIASGQFRQDLYYRLNGLVVKLPPLRERTDFAMVIKKILLSVCENEGSVTVSPEVMGMFQRFAWPGNIRQLHNLLRTATAMVGCSGEIGVEHLPDDFLEEINQDVSVAAHTHLGVAPHGPAHAVWTQLAVPSPAPYPSSVLGPMPTGPASTLGDVALQAMADALRQCRGNVSAAAKMLGVSRNTIYRKKDQLPHDLIG